MPQSPGVRSRPVEVLESLADEPEHLVAPVVRLDELGMLGEMTLKPLLVGRQPKEPVALGQPRSGTPG